MITYVLLFLVSGHESLVNELPETSNQHQVFINQKPVTSSQQPVFIGFPPEVDPFTCLGHGLWWRGEASLGGLK